MLLHVIKEWLCCVCTWSSSSATTAICEGKALYVKSKNCFFYNMNSGDIKDIENLNKRQ